MITHVETTSAPVSDDARTEVIHEALKQKALLPKQHIVDTGYVDAKLLIESQQNYQIYLIGPTRRNYHWQARQQKGFDADHFLIDWQAEHATYPEGHTSSSWTPAIDNRTNEVIKIKFSSDRLPGLPEFETLYAIHSSCAPYGAIRPKEQYEALLLRRKQEATQVFKKLYTIRAGVEGTISQGVRMMGLRRSRYIGQQKTHLQHLATASAMNLMRLDRWRHGIPHTKTRLSAFAQIHCQVA